MKEKWNKYLLEDGVLLKLKFVLKKLFEVKETDTQGQMSFDFQNVITLGRVPERLRGPSSIEPLRILPDNIIQKHLDFDIENEYWNEYILHDDHRRVKIKLSLKNVDKSNLFDKHGEPVYSIGHGLEVVVLPAKDI